MFDILLCIKTSLNILNLRKPWNRLVTQIDKQRSLFTHSAFPYDVNTWALLAKGELGGFFYDLTCQNYVKLSERMFISLLSAEIQTVIAGADEYIDVMLYSSEDRVLVIESLWNVLYTGKVNRSDMPPEVRSLYPFCIDIHNKVKNLSNPLPFWQESEYLTLCVLEQVKGNKSIDIAKATGAHAIGVSAVLSQCLIGQQNHRYLEASHALGAYFNLADDLQDIQEDRRQQTITPLSHSEDIINDTNKVKNEMSNCWNSCKDLLNKNDFIKFNTIASMLHIMWIVSPTYSAWDESEALGFAPAR